MDPTRGRRLGVSDPSLSYVVFSTIVLIVLSAFFVVIEFSLLAARRHRVEKQAATRWSARAALRGMNELSIMLAVAQFGITICTFALGAITKPAVEGWLGPILINWGAPAWLADSGAFLLSLLFVTFLHLVIGEMAPKSWTIAHPEFAANIIGIPSRAMAWCLRPLLLWVNRIANRLVAASGHVPAESRAVGGQDPAALRQLVEYSAAVGTLDDTFRAQLGHIFDLEGLKVGDLIPQATDPPAAVQEHVCVEELRQRAAASGHLRILVERDGRLPGVLHVRDVLLEPPDRPVSQLMREPLVLDIDTRVYDAVATMRDRHEQFAVVSRAGKFAGIVTLSDVVRRVLPGGAVLEL